MSDTPDKRPEEFPEVTQSTDADATDRAEENQLPVGADQLQPEVVGVRRGMFGVRDSGDTSGYGGLVRPVVMPGGTTRPFGGWFDDVADSRWTLTVAARALRQAGAPAVLPFALAIDA